ncbi:MAG TPA: UrcA family protein, partial [Caulobacterales bacterium]|nr:UrcA family protein [Caulobacterales bacterium]
MRTLLMSACIFGCFATQALAADHIVVPYTQADLADEASLSTLYGKIAAAAKKLCRNDSSLLRAQGYIFDSECEDEAVKNAVVKAKAPALVAYAESVKRGENASAK